ncbi:arylamine N-acetyltransferase [Kitasatospora sp. NPDC094015]|uniref:arylamine N-acetyltransferase family protein n=1 Tax=Kitasatospora sp. NPDC094015 TaxID=3155205 RepID=UPI00332DE119
MDHTPPAPGLTEPQVTAYLDRIGAPRPARPDAQALAALQSAHLLAVPFENLSIHLDEPVRLDLDLLLEKIVGRRRGGFCYELNGAFAELLRALGYRVTLHSARVFAGERPGPPQDHLALLVDLGEPWLVDVGFGRFSKLPLRLDERGEQPDPCGVFTVRPHGEEVDVLLDGTPQYRLDLRPYRLTDFVPTCWWQTTSPDSHFTRSPTCSLLTEDGRVTISGTRLIRTTAVDGRTERVLGADEALAAYRELFGIVLDRLPAKH